MDKLGRKKTTLRIKKMTTNNKLPTVNGSMQYQSISQLIQSMDKIDALNLIKPTTSRCPKKRIKIDLINSVDRNRLTFMI